MSASRNSKQGEAFVVWVCADWRERDAAKTLIEARSGQKFLFRTRDNESPFQHHFLSFDSGDIAGVDLYLIVPDDQITVSLTVILTQYLSELTNRENYGHSPLAVFSTGVCAGYCDPSSTADILGDICVAESAVSFRAGGEATSPVEFAYNTQTQDARGRDLWQAFYGDIDLRAGLQSIGIDQPPRNGEAVWESKVVLNLISSAGDTSLIRRNFPACGRSGLERSKVTRS